MKAEDPQADPAADADGIEDPATETSAKGLPTGSAPLPIPATAVRELDTISDFLLGLHCARRLRAAPRGLTNLRVAG